MAASKGTAVGVAAAGLVLAGLAVTEGYGEIIPYFASGVSDAQRFGAIASDSFVPASSRWSRDLFLTDCLEVPRLVYALAQPSALRRRFLENCRDRAAQVAAAAPNASNAWLVVATTSAALKDYATMRSALAMSKRTAPNLQWLADRRSQLAEANATELDDTGRADYEHDLTVLASGYLGIAVLAQRYVRSDGLRETYLRILDSASPEQKQRFLARVKSEMAS